MTDDFKLKPVLLGHLRIRVNKRLVPGQLGLLLRNPVLKNPEKKKEVKLSWVVVAHSLSPSTREAEADGLLSSRTAYRMSSGTACVMKTACLETTPATSVTHKSVIHRPPLVLPISPLLQ